MGSKIETLISAIQSPEGLNVAFLKRLYLLLLASLPLNEEMRSSNLKATFDHCGLLQLQTLTNILYKDLDRRFELFFADYIYVSGISGGGASQEEEHTEGADHELLHLLLRCCMLVLTSDDPMLDQRIQFLLSLVRRLMAPVATCGGDEKSTLRFRNFASSICPLLEIFADELLKCRFLRQYFIMVDSAACATEMLFRSHYVGRDIATVLEVISVHFMSSVYCSGYFLERLSCGVGKHSRVPQLSLNAAMSLLLNPVMLSAPKMLHADLILLVSEAIDVNMSTKNARPDLRLMECYQGALERSIELYTSHMTSSLVDSHTMGGKCSNLSSTMVGSSFQPSFEFYIQQVTKDKILEYTNSDSLPDCSMICVAKAGIMADSTAYINESQHIYDESCKEDISAVLNGIMRVSFSSDAGGASLYRKGKTSLQDIYFLGSILKLMGTSFLNTVWCIRHGGNVGCPKTIKDSSSKEYDRLVGTIGCFRQFNLSLPHQKCLSDIMKTCLLTHTTSKRMLLHFTGLLSLSFASGIDFLVKGCISTIMASLNLYVFEEGGIADLRSLLVSGSQTFSCGLSSEKAVAIKKSIASVALKFQKIHALHSSTLSGTEESSDGIKETEETCDGKIFLTCILGSSQQSEIDDLADFIECRPCKDYSLWLKMRQRYQGVKRQRRKWRVLERKKIAWKSISGMHHSRSGNIILESLGRGWS